MASKDASVILDATLDSPKLLVNMIKSISLGKRATIEASSEGLKLVSEENKWIQAVAFLQSKHFKEFTFNGHCEDDDDLSSVSFVISLEHFEQSLNLYGSNAYGTVKIIYPGADSSFVLFIENNGVFISCKLFTYVVEDEIEIECLDEVTNRVLFQSEILKEIWAESDQTASMVQMAIGDGQFSLSTTTMKVEVASDSDSVILFESHRSQELCFNLKLLRATQKALNLSEKTSIRLSAEGTVALQFLMKSDTGADWCSEFFCKSLQFDDEVDGDVVD